MWQIALNIIIIVHFPFFGSCWKVGIRVVLRYFTYWCRLNLSIIKERSRIKIGHTMRVIIYLKHHTFSSRHVLSHLVHVLGISEQFVSFLPLSYRRSILHRFPITHISKTTINPVLCHCTSCFCWVLVVCSWWLDPSKRSVKFLCWLWFIESD